MAYTDINICVVLSYTEFVSYTNINICVWFIQ